MLDSKLVVVVSNLKYDKTIRKVISNHSITMFVLSKYPIILAFLMEKILVGLVKDVQEMGIKKGSKLFSHVLHQLIKMDRTLLSKNWKI